MEGSYAKMDRAMASEAATDYSSSVFRAMLRSVGGVIGQVLKS